MRSLLLGIDIGTSACKVAAFDRSGNVVAQGSAAYPVYYPFIGWAEQNPEDWWRACCEAIKALFEQGVEPHEIKAVGVDGQSWSAIAVDDHGDVLCNTPIWMDTRASEICKKWESTFGKERIFETNGNPVQPMYTMPKVQWYKENQPEVYKHARKILQSNSFIVYRMTGCMTQDVSQGYGWNCFNMQSCSWDEDLCRDMGIETGLLPKIVQCHSVVGGISPAASLMTGLTEGTPVVAGGLDAACGTLGVGVIHAGETQEQGGQAGGMSICVDSAKADERLILGAHVVPGLWLLQGGTVGGSASLKWFEQEFGAAERELARASGSSSFEELSREAQGIQAGSEGLIFLPYMSGERSPIWNAKAKGVFYGMDFSKSRAHFARAVMEGVAYSLRHNLEVAATAGAEVGTMYAMGGAANSHVWTQIKADITGKRMIVPNADTATALGAAILAGVGVGLYADFEEAVRSTLRIQREHEPRRENKEVYDRGYQNYRGIYEQLKVIMNEA